MNQLDGMSGVTILRARWAPFSVAEDERVHAQIDGEYAGRLPGQVKIALDALTMLIPNLPAFPDARGRGSSRLAVDPETICRYWARGQILHQNSERRS